MCILILNINGRFRTELCTRKENMRVILQWGVCDVQQIISEMLMTVHALKKSKKESGAQKSRISRPNLA
jgi:hypothetical protein